MEHWNIEFWENGKVSACASHADKGNCKILLLKQRSPTAGLNKIERSFNRLILIKINVIEP